MPYKIRKVPECHTILMQIWVGLINKFLPLCPNLWVKKAKTNRKDLIIWAQMVKIIDRTVRKASSVHLIIKKKYLTLFQILIQIKLYTLNSYLHIWSSNQCKKKIIMLLNLIMGCNFQDNFSTESNVSYGNLIFPSLYETTTYKRE